MHQSRDWQAWLPPAGWTAEAFWEDPGDWHIISVDEEGLRPNDIAQDASVVLQDILRRTSGHRVLYFPAGDYWFRSPCSLSVGHVIIRGAGMDQTRFFQDTKAKAHLGFAGQIDETPIALVGEMPTRGATEFTVADAEQIQVGDFVKLFQENPNTEGSFGHLSTFCWSQILRVVEKDGNLLRVDMKLGLDYHKHQQPRLVKMQMVTHVGVEDFYIEKLQDNDDFTLFFYGVYNGFMRAIRSKYTSKAHFKVRESRRVIVRDCEAELSLDYGGNGHGYGVVFSDNATRCYAFNNTCGAMRHPFHIQRGANHCVYAYNFAYRGDVWARGKRPHDCRLHGGWVNNNLFEGNVAHVWMADQVNAVNGPYNTWFRNKTFFGRYEHGTHWSAVGNVFTTSGQGAPKDLNDFAGANMTAEGQVDWGALSETDTLPESLCFQKRPTFITSDWPVFGPGAGSRWGRDRVIPAQVRYQNRPV